MHKETRRLFRELVNIQAGQGYRCPMWVCDNNKAYTLTVNVKSGALRISIFPDGSYRVLRLYTDSVTTWDSAPDTSPKGLLAAQFQKDKELVQKLYVNAELHAEANYAKDVDNAIKSF